MPSWRSASATASRVVCPQPGVDVSSPARPSPTDLRESHYPDSLYLLVSLDPREADPSTGAPSVRAWRIVAGGVHEVPLTIQG